MLKSIRGCWIWRNKKASAEEWPENIPPAMTRCSELSRDRSQEVRSFDENEVKMDTSCGILLIRGEGLT